MLQEMTDGFTPMGSPSLPQIEASATYALDLGAIWAILAAFTHILTIEEKSSLPLICSGNTG
jgi:hypothetical protein